MNKNSRKFKIAIVIILIQALIIVGVLVGTRVLYPQSFGYIDEVPWDNLPTMTKHILQDTPTKTIEPIRVLFDLENCTYPSTLILEQLSNAEGIEADVWIWRQKYTKSEAFSIINGDFDKTYRDLFFQLYTTKINILLGVDASLIEVELFEAETWIGEYDPDGVTASGDLVAAVKLTHTLNEFNNGVIGPGLCEDTAASLGVSSTPDRLSLEIYTLTPVFQNTPTPTPTPSLAYTPTPTTTSSPTRTPTPTISNTPYAGVVWTSTPTPTKTDKPDDPDPTKEEPNPTARNTRVAPTDPPPTDPPPTEEPTEEPTPTLANP